MTENGPDHDRSPATETGPIDFSDWSRAELIARLRLLEEAREGDPEDGADERLAYELEANRVELEMQNRELREMQAQLEASRDLYADLYDAAPVGYVALDRKGGIAAINLTGARMLGTERPQVRGKPFSAFLAAGDATPFFAYLRHLFETGHTAAMEVRLKGVAPGGPRSVVVEGVLNQRSEEIEPLARLALTDITEIKQAQADQARANRALRSLNAVHRAEKEAADPDDNRNQ